MWDPLRSDPAQSLGCALPHPRLQMQVWLWGAGRPPPPDDCTCRVKPRLKSPPTRGAAEVLPHPCAARGAPDGLPHALPCPPVSHCRAPLPALPAEGGRGGGGCAAPAGGGSGTTSSLSLALSLTPLTQGSSLWPPLCLHHRKSCSNRLPQTLPCSTLLPLIDEGWGGTSTLPIRRPPCSPLTPLTQGSSLWLPLCLHHRKSCSTLLPQTLPCSTLLPLIAEGWGGIPTLPIPKPPCSPMLLAGWRWVTLCPICPCRINERGRDGAKNVREARAPPKRGGHLPFQVLDASASPGC